MTRAARHADGFIGIGASTENCRTNFDSMDAQAQTLGDTPHSCSAHVSLLCTESLLRAFATEGLSFAGAVAGLIDAPNRLMWSRLLDPHGGAMTSWASEFADARKG